ncbi:leucine-rich repeat protein [Prevotella copri]|uniref:Leucine-rich repeat protein n=1 Tax=Segatella copri TaxID=165179 RepID=A0A6G1U4R7_9BACT|nr:leucine-rich repeat protein [Segatella copri]MQN81761.1 leucine-rich repeat protein [Segatella copri]
MKYPLISEYIESIKNSEDNFNELTNLRPVYDEAGEIVMSSGNFAVVFKMKDESSGKLYAVKCFLKEQEGRDIAYQQITDELEYVSSNYLCSIKYFQKELFVDSTVSSDTEFPVLLMDWVEGVTLDKYVHQHISDKYALQLITYQFCRMAAWLMSQPFAHGDLKPDNILVTEDGALVLVDYDGMYVPAMQGQKARELGSPDYRHPLRTEDCFNEHIDDFPLALIGMSLKAIALDTSLLQNNASSDSLLFSESDFKDIGECQMMKSLCTLLNDAEFSKLYALFILAHSQQELSAVSFRLFLLNKDWGYPPRQKQNYSQIQITNVIKKVNEIAVINDLLLSDKLIKWNEDNNTFRVSLRITYTSLPSDNDKGVDGLLSLANFEDTGAVVGKTYSCLINFDSLLTDKHDERTQKKALDELVKKFKGKKARFSTFEFRISELSGGKGESINDGTHTYSSLANTYLGKVNDEDAEFNKLKERMNDMLDDDFEFGEAGQNQKVEKPIEEVLSTEATEEDLKDAIEDEYGVKYSRDGKKLLKAPFLFGGEEYVVREGTEVICDGALQSTGIRSVKLPSTIISIGSVAFADNYLVSCNIPASVKYIAHNNPWGGCDIMNMDIQSKNFIIKDGILYSSDFRIVYGAIYWKSVFNIDNRSKKICANAFWSSFENKNILKSIGLSNIEYIGTEAFRGCVSLQDITIPSSVTYIGDEAFGGCESLQSVIIPNSVTSIRNRAFFWCQSLQSITIPNSVTSIGNRAFCWCKSLQSVTIPNSVTSIGDEAFIGCESLQSVTIPNSVTKIGDGAFLLCTHLDEPSRLRLKELNYTQN